MNAPRPIPRRQAGSLLVEALVALLIFALGLLGVIGLQAASIRNSGIARQRIEASFLVNQLIGRMWADDRIPAHLQASYQGSAGSGGAGYTAWLADVRALLPGVASGAVPAPAVDVVTVNGAAPPDTAKSLVTITLRWQQPGTGEVHRYVAVTEIK
jgi:type IV pilus assembly protein PilV